MRERTTEVFAARYGELRCLAIAALRRLQPSGMGAV